MSSGDPYSTSSWFHQQNFPVVFRNKITDWKVVNYNTEDWCKVFKSKILKFKQGRRAYTSIPYWDYLCETKELSVEEFFQLSTSDSNHWLYFDYKYFKDVFSPKETFTQEIKWSDLGLLNINEEEAALWMGNKGAHTPCHKDTYGCNIVAQLFGRKLWILMPPEESENLMPVRVPYEESSIYSLYNFYMPNNSLLNVRNAYTVVLSAGDVLFVPRHWWHYVENIEPAISTNIWLPMDEDHESRLEESLVKHYVSNICQDLSEEESKQILHPNEYNLISEPCTLSTVALCLENYKKYKEKKDSSHKSNTKQIFIGESAQVERLNIDSYIKAKAEAQNYSIFASDELLISSSDRLSLARNLINSYCHPSNILTLKNSLVKL